MNRSSTRLTTTLIILTAWLLPALWLSACTPMGTRSPAAALPQAAAKPAADAVNVLIDKQYQVHQDGSYTMRLHLVRRILTYKGKKDYADFKFTYNDSFQTVTIGRARTTTADGQVVDAGQDEIHDILAPWTASASIYSHTRQKVVNLPSVAPGSTIELELTLESKKGFWLTESFRLPEPIVKKTVTVTLPAAMPWHYQQPSMVSRQISRQGPTTVYHWQAADVPRLVPEKLTPARENLDCCLLAAAFSDWSAVAAWYQRYFRPALQAAGGQKPASLKLDDASVDRLYISLMRQLTPHPIAFLGTGLQPQTPAVTLKKGYGTQVDLALAFCQLLRQRHLEPRILLVGNEDLFLADLQPVPSPSFFGKIVVRCGGKDYAFWKQELPPGYTGYEGRLGLDLTAGRLVPLQSTFTNSRQVYLTLHPTGRGYCEGSVKIILTGQDAVATRDNLRYLTPEERRVATSRIVHALSPLAKIEGELQTTGLDELDAPVTIACRFTINRGLVRAGGYRLAVLPLPELTREYEDCLPARRSPLLIGSTSREILDFTLELPPDCTLVQEPASFSYRQPPLTSEQQVSRQGNKLHISRRLQLQRAIIPLGTAYQQFLRNVTDLHRLEDKIIALQ
ncbi:MAG: DUF3857 domain-containing protein [Deltaproteobacteria bacterium]|nr:DUF3857 domain-containing protein [Deltaproteobacteria bacterium]